MIEKGKISAFQMGMMMYSMPIATGIVLLPAITAKHAGRDLWLAAILASVVGFILVYTAHRFNKFYPGKTIMEYSISILGRIPGKMMGFIYLFFYLHLSGIVIRQYGEFIVGNFLRKTPITVVMGIMVLVCALAVRSGLEVLGRSAQTFIFLLICLILVITLLLIPEMKPGNMLPILEHGLQPVIKGAFPPMDWFSSYFVMMFLLPFLSDKQNGMKWGMISVFAVMVTMIISNLIALFLFSDIIASLNYPLMAAVRKISLASFFEHVEAFVMAIWILGAFIQISMHFYTTVLAAAQWLELESYRPIVFPLGFLLTVLGVWVAPNSQEMSYILGTTFTFYALSIRLLIPLLLLLIAAVKNRKNV
ncbi:GerAB/ArcD/ProY family transporter [Paenibacillus eucommiae]|uniref:Spore germination protein KB n=1 Tax=Paenibacillus eucommiae TaxID=1355755 RepID=A0ABS4IQZ8_9BACL|nr:endospore germination permease [Paenibacillus eucommiae]MBP1989997.1 spore germination protein KB [Paenibacillus eucommiae]